jgi:hypothetical protein
LPYHTIYDITLLFSAIPAMPNSGIPRKMFFAAVAVLFLRAVACFALLDQVFAPVVWKLNRCGET